MDKDIEGKMNLEEVDSKLSNVKTEAMADNSIQNINLEKHDEPAEEKKEDEEEDEEEEEEEEDRIIEKSPNLRFHKRNKKYMRKVPGIDNSFIAIEPKSGKEVIWNEINLSDKKTEQENRFINLIKKLKRYNHPFFVRFLEVWQTKPDTGCRKVIFITERLTDPTMKQYFVNSSCVHRLTNKSLWRKFVGQLISVLKFLNHLGVNHGNLSNETVYYQNTGCLKVGTLSVDLSFDNKPSTDIYDMGKLALEMAAYEALDDNENLSIKDRIHKMLGRINDTFQSNFIQMCLDNAENPTTLTKLFQHIALKEVPSLKRLAAKIIVQNSISTNEDEKVERQLLMFSNIFKDQVSHFEDETVLFKVVFHHDNITKLRLWKEYRINFLNLPKYIEDVRNGFYPIFEAKSGQIPEEVDDITYSYSVDQELTKEGPVSKDSCLSQFVDNFDSVKEFIPAAKSTDLIDKLNVKDQSTDLKLEEISNTRSKPESLVNINTIDTKSDRHTGTSHDKASSSHQKDIVSLHDSKIDNLETIRRGSAEDAKLDVVVDAAESSHPDTQTDNVTAFEDNGENELDEDDDEDEDEDFNNGGPERMEPYWDYVSPPEKPPSDRALFTGCMYSYIGCGRWQIYVQIWFLEDRLKREVIIQVMEHEWSNDSHVATMFVNGKIISSADKPVLERILGYARHNCPLMEGELIPPQKKLANFDAYDLYQRLEHLQMFTKARQLLEKAEAERGQLAKNIASPIELSGVVSPTARVPNPTQGQSSLATPREPFISQPLLDDCNKKDIKISPLSDSSNVDDKAAILKGIKIGELPGFKMELMDIRVLAPLNYRCMFCDNHEYLHSEDLPPYLSSPCYHCREGLAKESKISPANLFDLHQQNFIPWPAFLQVRYNIPPVSFSNSPETSTDSKTLRDLIDYDCKWRGRVPCHCYPGVELPPCVEFPNIYMDDSSEILNISYSINEHYLDHKSGIISDNPIVSAPIGSVGTIEINSDNVMKQSNVPLNFKQYPNFPCNNRHMKGATITCVHGITFPRMSYPSSTQPFYKKHVR